MSFGIIFVGIFAPAFFWLGYFTMSLALRIPAALLILLVWVWRIRILEKLNSSAHP